MQTFFLIKPGEIELKLGNKQAFIRRLKEQIHNRLKGIHYEFEEYPGRFFLSVNEEHAQIAQFVLQHCPGINGVARALKAEKNPDDIIRASIEITKNTIANGARTFKVETRRSDKSFSLDSYEMSVAAADALLTKYPELSVDVHSPDFILMLEIRERAYIYANTEPGPRGLPIGTQGKGLLLLSGGIDSPVAGFMMARRGLALEAVYFHTYPYTYLEAQKKVERLATRLAAWTGRMRLWIVSFTEVQHAIARAGRSEANTIMLRMAMMNASSKIASKINAKAIITGESLGQVASQTVENISLSQSQSLFPIFRPLIGTDKEDIITTAKRIGTYDISILPYEDCCVLFSPKHPLLKPDFNELKKHFDSLELDTPVSEAIEHAEEKSIYFSDVLREYGY
jgi:thiamine biosynthesis protein ThiI